MSNIPVVQILPFSRRTQLSITLAYNFVFVVLGLVAVSFGPTLPGLAEQTQSNLSQISYLFTARALGGLLGSFGLGRLYDRLPGHILMALLLSTMTVMLLLTPLVPALWLLSLILLVLGIAEGGMHVGGNTLVVWIYGGRVGPVMTGMHFFFGVGALLSPIIVAQIMLITGTIRWPYWILAIIILPAVVWLTRLPSPSLPTSSTDSVVRPINRRLVTLFTLFFFLYVGTEISMSGWIFTYTLTVGLGQAATAAYLTSAFWGAITLARLVAIPAAAHLRPRTILLFDLIGALISAGIILAWSGSLAAIWVGTLGLGLSLGSVFPTTMSLAGRRMAITGSITGLFLVGSSLGAMSLPWLIGQLFEPVGPQTLLLTIITALLLAGGVLLGLLRFKTVQPTRQSSAQLL